MTSPEFIEATSMGTNILPYMASVSGAAILVGGAAKTLSIVHKGEAGIHMRKGTPLLEKEYSHMAPEQIEDYIDQADAERIFRIREKGVIFLRPFFDTVDKVNVTDRNSPLDEMKFETTDGYQLEVAPSFTWYVRPDGNNPYKSRFRITNEKTTPNKDKDFELQQRVVSICTAGLGKVLRQRDYKEIRNYDLEQVTENSFSSDQLHSETYHECSDKLLRYGVELRATELKPIVRTPAQLLKEAILGETEPSHPAIVASAAAGGMVPDLHIVPPNDAA